MLVSSGGGIEEEGRRVVYVEMWRGEVCFCFFFPSEDGIRDGQEARGLGRVYKGQG